MKQLTCEMCGSTDLIKQDGVFVCQSCGIKYSVEEAKKMMVEVEGTVEVTGTVKVDSTDKLNNLYLLARRAKDDNNTEDAAKYYNEIRLHAPNDWEAVFYSLYFTTMQTTIGRIESAAISMSNGLNTVIELIKDLPCDQHKDIYYEVSDAVFVIGSILESNANDHYHKVTEYHFDSEAQEEYFAQRKASLDLLYDMALYLLEDFLDAFATKEFLNKVISYILERYPDRTSHLGVSPFWQEVTEYNRFFKLHDIIDQSIKDQEEKERQERISAYWAEHKEQKNNLDNRLSEIERELSQLIEQRDALNKKKTALNNKKNDKTPAEKEAYSVSLKIDSLKKEFASLGIFSGKRKKEIQAELELINTEQENLERLSREQRTQMQNDIQAEIRQIDAELAPIKAQIESLKTEEKTIADELNKDR